MNTIGEFERGVLYSGVYEVLTGTTRVSSFLIEFDLVMFYGFKDLTFN